MLAFAWVPLTAHCQMEAVPGFEFLRCSTDTQSTSETGDPCKDGGCCSVETAKYQAHRNQETGPVALVAILVANNFGVAEKSLPAEVCLGILTAAPPHLPTSWQFSLRAALPVRAPSLAS